MRRCLHTSTTVTIALLAASTVACSKPAPPAETTGPSATIAAPPPPPPASAPLGTTTVAPSSTGSGEQAPPPPPAGPAELALIEPLVPGLEHDGWLLRTVSGVQDGVMRLAFEQTKEKGRVVVIIALEADDGPTPPATAGRFALFYTSKRVESDDAAALTRGVAEIVRGHKAARIPAGMTVYRPEKKPGQSL